MNEQTGNNSNDSSNAKSDQVTQSWYQRNKGWIKTTATHAGVGIAAGLAGFFGAGMIGDKKAGAKK